METNTRCPTVRSGWRSRMRIRRGSEPKNSEAHKRVNPGNRSCRGSMLCPPFGFQSTHQQYSNRTVVPADLANPEQKSVGQSVDKPVGLGATRKEPRQAFA